MKKEEGQKRGGIAEGGWGRREEKRKKEGGEHCRNRDELGDLNMSGILRRKRHALSLVLLVQTVV